MAIVSKFGWVFNGCDMIEVPTCFPFGAFPPRRAAAGKHLRAKSVQAAALLGYVRDSQRETEDRLLIRHIYSGKIVSLSLPKGVLNLAQECRGSKGFWIVQPIRPRLSWAGMR